MKKNLLTISLLIVATFSGVKLQAQRYWTYVFPSANVTSNITYANNYSIITGSPVATDLKMDIYEPGGLADPITARPLIIYLHTGSFLPVIFNNSPTGTRADSATVEMCTRFARRGFVAASIDYRLGWNPQSTDQDVRTGTLLQAVYRALQDTKCCVRYFRKNADIAGNTFKVDTNNITLVGQGSGGYVTLAYATLNDPIQIDLPKFLSNTNNPTYGFNAGFSYVPQYLLGDFDGYGAGGLGLNNPNNSVGYSNAVNFVCNMGGSIGDSSWLQPGNVPMVGFHVPSDPFAPYGNGIVTVPGLGYNVVAVSGDSVFIRKADAVGNNASFINNNYTDVYTTHANMVNGGQEGLYPLYEPGPQAAPWEWFDSLTTVFVATHAPFNLTAAQGTAIYQSALLTNPNMSKAKAMAYIDTIQGYLVPRIIKSTSLQGVEENVNDAIALQMTPNPARDYSVVTLKDASYAIHGVEIINAIGQVVYRTEKLNTQSFQINRSKLDAGVYLIRIKTDKGASTRKLIFE